MLSQSIARFVKIFTQAHRPTCITKTPYYTGSTDTRKHTIMSTEFHSKEHQIIATLRKVLSDVVRDTTPSSGRPHPLSPQTVDNVKMAFQLITAREKEIIEAAGGNMDKRPRYADEPKTSQVVEFTKPKNKDK